MPKHSDFQEIYDAMQKEYCTGETEDTKPEGGPCTRGDEVYHAWLNKHGYDDTKSLESQKSAVRHIEFDKLFIELFRRLRSAALGFYENWLQEQALDDTLAISLQKSEFLKDGGRLYFTKEDALHVRIDGMLSGSFEKLDGADDLIVAGYASTCVEDTWGDKFTPDMIREGAEKYLETPIVFYCHRRSEPAGLVLRDYTNPSGKLFETKIDEVGWYVVSRPSNALRNVTGLIREGLLKAYSIGGYYIFDRFGGLVGTTIHDVSYVPRPANRLSYHGIVSRVGIQKGDRKELEKEEVLALIDEKLKAFTTEINDGLDDFKAGFDARLKAVDELENNIQSLKGFDYAAIDTKIASLEAFKESLEGLVERLEKVEGFNKAFGEDFEYAKLEERIVAIEDMPLVKGISTLPPQSMTGIHEKIAEAGSFEEGARLIRGLQR